ncbi:MAG TPA: hypothetical protein VLL95_16435 [Phnomibacter sp.]|nr:hypothetical protein [Phnomibacter sp.]
MKSLAISYGNISWQGPWLTASNTLAIQSEEGMILLGFSQKDGQFFQNKASFPGIKVFDTKGKLVWEQKMNK